ncbi:MAG: PQQ-binding-like beta-propeller repeat protein [Bryobacterales bacterium]|nr:PQQ-binding-like beta-propeller repeat protein [Bryobacterales bacterium]
MMTTRLLSLFLLPCFLGLLPAGDWTDYRGPNRDGSSPDKNLPSKWSVTGENLAWKAPYGGRSAPVIHGDRMYVMNGVGSGSTLHERLMCLNADNGQVIWEHHMKAYLSDVPAHRVSWASPVVDPETGNVYAFGVGGLLAGLNRQGKLLWEHSMAEEQGLVTTHGGRTVSPVVYENLVIVGGVSTGWGEMARPAHRYFAFDKRNGQFVWISTPGGRPFDTTYSPGVITELNGVKLFVAGGGDGDVHAIKVLTGEPVWSFTMSERGINTGVLVYRNQAIVSHGEENLDTSAMRLPASIDAAGRGNLGPRDVKWKAPGFQGGYSTPVMDGDRVFQSDNGANLYALDFHTGKVLWKQNLGTIQKASPVIADGKIYVGTEGGKFFILKPHADHCEILSEVELGKVAGEEQVIASAAVARGRVYFVSTQNIYALGRKGAGIAPPPYRPEPQPHLAADVPATYVQVVPAEVILRSGETVRFKASTFDVKGRFIQETKAEWSLEGLKGKVEDGSFSATAVEAQAGNVKATVGGISGTARVRVVPPLPWSENFDNLAPGAPPKH